MNPVFVISLSSTFISLTFSHYLTFFSRVDVGLLFPTCQRRGNLFSIIFGLNALWHLSQRRTVGSVISML